MSYCRITGRSRSLPKPNYFPLLPPISPTDAKRFCRITGKSYGLQSHRYIPVVLTTFSNTSKCKITNSTDFGPHSYEPDYNYGKRRHVLLAGYRYVVPVFDETNNQQKTLIDLLNSKVVQCDEHSFVYSIAERKFNLVFSARLEAAVRDGDVRDVMFARTNDSVLLRMRKGKQVSLDLQDFSAENGNVEKYLLEGEGTREDVLMAQKLEQDKQQIKRTKHRRNLSQMTRIFENDSQLMENGHDEHKQNGIIREDPTSSTVNKNDDLIKSNGLNAVNGVHSETNGIADDDSLKSIQPEIDQNENIQNMKIDFETIASINVLSKNKLIESIQAMNENQKGKLAATSKRIMDDVELSKTIPYQSEIFKIMQNYSKGIIIGDDVSGLSINIDTDEMPRNILLLGCTVNTKDGDVFIAGRTIPTENGLNFEPGITVNTKSGPTFIPGQVIYTEEGERFVPGQVFETEDGPRFVPGKVIEVDGKVTFIPAQIVQTDQGPKFIAPDLSDDENGEQSYSVQSFLVSPEELTLLKPSQSWTSASQMSQSMNGDSAINLKLLRQLSEAGLSTGHHSSEMNVMINRSGRNSQAIQKMAENLNCTEVAQTTLLETLFERIKEMIHDVSQKTNTEILSALSLSTSFDSNDINKILSQQMGNTMNYSTADNCNVESHIIDILSSTVIECMVLWAKQTNMSKSLNIITDLENEKSTSAGIHGIEQKLNDPMLEHMIGEILCAKINKYTEQMSQSNGSDVNDCNNITLLTAIESMLASPLALQQFENAVDSLADQTIQGGKMNLIEAFINNNRIETDADILKTLSAILGNEHEDELIDAIHELYDSEPNLMQIIVNELKNGVAQRQQLQLQQQLNTATTTTNNKNNNNDTNYDLNAVVTTTAATSAVETIKTAIVSAVQRKANEDINQIIASLNQNKIADSTNEHLNVYLMDTVALARALGLMNCAQNIMTSMHSHNDIADHLKQNEQAYELLQRVIVMHKLAKRDENQKSALELLRRDPYTARNDAGLRKLWRIGGLCTLRSDQKAQLTDSREVPLTLIYSGNQLAIEDFLMRCQTKSRGAFLICKDGYQAVVPRESSRDVLIGKCAYTMLDENGIRHFEPLHVFSALKLKNVQMFAHRFTSYSGESTNKNNMSLDIDVESILTMSSSPQTTSSSLSSDYYHAPELRNKSTIYWPRRDFNSDSYAKRRNIFAGNQAKEAK